MQLLQNKSERLVAWVHRQEKAAGSPFELARRLMRRLGANVAGGSVAQFGFWIPEVAALPHVTVRLEILTALAPLDLTLAQQQVTFERHRLPIALDGDYAWGVYEGLSAGSRHTIGDFYWLAFQSEDGVWQHIHDHLACSLPFGCFAPAELYDFKRMQSERSDRSYFKMLDGVIGDKGILRINPPANMLQLHVASASAGGTLQGLTDIFQAIAAKVNAGQPLTPFEQNYSGYDAIQLMPIEPGIEFEDDRRFWQQQDTIGDLLTVDLRRPNMTNWGYDVLTSGSPAVNAPLLASGRPDEFVDLIATLHNFPGKPIKVVLDVVYGHSDNQALPLLNREFVAGPNMYGQYLAYDHPVTRAYLLEMMRRKNNFGIDGVRIDGAQDFKVYDAERDLMLHDDHFLRLINDEVQQVGGTRYHPWMIFEDGRPWPRDDWELASSYREVTTNLPNAAQWGPLTFSHITPYLFTFWISKWWRIREILAVGSHWISGCANHDTLRRGAQVALDARVNSYLGCTLPEIFKNGYDNPAATLFTYAILPGVPMDFINALQRAPWGFVRNTDDRWGVKVVSEESRFLYWNVDQRLWQQPTTFPRLKEQGFATLLQLRRFMVMLDKAVQATDYDLEAVAKVMAATGLYSECRVSDLQRIARMWMDDVAELCNVAHYADELDPQQTAFNLATRQFRRARPWLRANLAASDHVDYRHPTAGSVLFYGIRHAPDGEQLLFCANMEGAPLTVDFGTLLPAVDRTGWQPQLQTPGLDAVSASQPFELGNAEAILFSRHGG